jgi:hypothetical protein
MSARLPQGGPGPRLLPRRAGAPGQMAVSQPAHPGKAQDEVGDIALAE